MSVVIPVSNAGGLLRPCLDSVLEQDVARGMFEVVAVDDGSTDGSGAVLDGYAAAHPNVHVVHEANSGGPGRPRNVGTDLARGDYVFYLDQDDMLGPEALRRTVEFADRHASDVVLVRTQWLKDERPLRDPQMETRVDAPLDRVFRFLAPHKLLRRSFVQAAGLRFPEGRVPLEDGSPWVRGDRLPRVWRRHRLSAVMAGRARQAASARRGVPQRTPLRADCGARAPSRGDLLLALSSERPRRSHLSEASICTAAVDTPPSDEPQVSVGVRSKPLPLLHQWQRSSDGLAAPKPCN